MNVLIRADASVVIGTGHVMRCLTLAQALRESGASVSFLCRELAGNLNSHIEAQGFRVYPIPLDESGNWDTDASHTQTAITTSGQHPGWIITDHYDLDARWESAMRPFTRHIMAIDDLADRPHDCDLLLDQNSYTGQETAYSELLPPHAIRLMGPQYALLRKEFAQTRAMLKPRDGSVKRILVFFGGSDPSNETEKALAALTAPDFAGILLDVVVGASNPQREKIRDLCASRPNTTFHCQASNMAELMAHADLSIGAGGTTSWERMALGLPTLVISVAANQEQIAEHLDALGAQRYLGKARNLDAGQLGAALANCLHAPADCAAMSVNAMALADGLGVSRVVAAMATGMKQIELRRATEDDERKLFEWRNAPETRRHAFDSNPIAWEDHVRWFRATLTNADRRLLIGEIDQEAVGVLRYDLAGDYAEISIYLVPGHSGRGLGTALLREGSMWIRLNLPQVRHIRAKILPDNLPSRKAFAKAGYMEVDGDFEYHIAPGASTEDNRMKK
ncbi:MAG: UDP-2,4-diacetamido-2,4,6-trideoxy-beta-L-altropyranose hydrolase [Sulfuricella denitrificans]|nr:UDP-2,4-diacetamido-2,4,6-trideoxy-beta-L-altropyranose hydrolase [Sulfuricella denitrificans]